MSFLSSFITTKIIYLLFERSATGRVGVAILFCKQNKYADNILSTGEI